jgi:hypothetical protein
MKAHVESSGVALILLLTPPLDGGGWSNSCPDGFCRERGPVLIGWVRKILPPRRFDSQTVQLGASSYTDYGITAHIFSYVRISINCILLYNNANIRNAEL